jgi:5'-phosphate synthase pdxT subunit
MRPPQASSPVVGVLALQGDFPAHERALAARGIACRRVTRQGQLAGLDALVLPGGESSVMLKLGREARLLDSLREAIAGGLPVLATCAGLILLAREVRQPPQQSLGLLDVVVARNGYGRQVHSGVYPLHGRSGFPDCTGVFIRAPRVVEVGPRVEVLATRDSDPCLFRAGAILAACFHPELDDGHPVHDLFLTSLGVAARCGGASA